MVDQSDVQLSLIRVKTDRAKHHILQVEEIAARIRPNVVSLFRDSKGNFVGPEPSRDVPVDLVTSAGDAIHNLRCALDHLAWHLAHWEHGKPGPKCGFPIGKSLKNYESMKPAMVAGMSTEAKKAIDDLRPYKGGNEPLWQIHHLDIVDKHRQLFVFGYRNLFSGLRLPGLFGTVTDQPAHFLGIFADDFQSEYNTPSHPTSTDLGVSKMQPLIPALHELLVFTEDLIQNFKPLLGKIRK
jgi:hypothetical protein